MTVVTLQCGLSENSTSCGSVWSILHLKGKELEANNFAQTDIERQHKSKSRQSLEANNAWWEQAPRQQLRFMDDDEEEEVYDDDDDNDQE